MQPSTYYLISSGGVIATMFATYILRPIFKAYTAFMELAATVKAIAGNHLPHIYDRLGNIETVLFERNSNVRQDSSGDRGRS